MIRVFIYDDDTHRRTSLEMLLNLYEDIQVVGMAENCKNALHDMESHQPDLVLMDINMPEVDGKVGLKIIKRNHRHIKIVIQTVFEDTEQIFECIKSGADGYILKKDSPEDILHAVRNVHAGGAIMNPGIANKVLSYFKPALQSEHSTLSQRENEVLTLLSNGDSYKMIADKLNVSYHTVNTHMKKIYEKLHVSSSGEAVAYYYKNMYGNE
ncbi:MAG TPA: response regulator transcription factor [Flavipsychrobacter sp.]|nr:response regulator transcription factor [Flavipsychrobacter sp.]